jgi:hypothetical protein
MIFENPALLKERIESVAQRRVYGTVRVIDDTTNYMSIEGGMVLRLEGNDYFIRSNARESRFGISDQPKFWVKYAIDLADGSRKILKLVFHERFTTPLGPLTVRCIRMPEKESRVLEFVRGDRRFMQGRTVRDAVGNNVRVIDFIPGDSLFSHIALLDQPHEVYFRRTLPGILRKLVGSIQGLHHLHQHDLQHGDVRNDHILVEDQTGDFRWIDFDYAANYLDYDIWSVGNLLTYAVGKGIRTCHDAKHLLDGQGGSSPAVCAEDALLFFRYRLANLRKLYPYVPKDLNALLMRFSAATQSFYQDCGEIARDLEACLATF